MCRCLSFQCMMKLLYAERALRAGARGYLMKREALDSILNAVHAVMNGEVYISPTMTKRMLFDHIHGGSETRSAVERLTDRELEVFQLIGEGRDMHEIARALHLSKKTVEAHRANIKEKLSRRRMPAKWCVTRRSGLVSSTKPRDFPLAALWELKQLIGLV